MTVRAIHPNRNFFDFELRSLERRLKARHFVRGQKRVFRDTRELAQFQVNGADVHIAEAVRFVLHEINDAHRDG